MSRSKSSLVSAVLAAASGAAVTAVANLGRAWTAHRHRRVVRDLLAFDDHMLRDIGLTRGDVTASLAMPVLSDPSTRLRILAVERRAGFRAQRRETIAALKATGSGNQDPANPATVRIDTSA